MELLRKKQEQTLKQLAEEGVRAEARADSLALEADTLRLKGALLRGEAYTKFKGTNAEACEYFGVSETTLTEYKRYYKERDFLTVTFETESKLNDDSVVVSTRNFTKAIAAKNKAEKVAKAEKELGRTLPKKASVPKQTVKAEEPVVETNEELEALKARVKELEKENEELKKENEELKVKKPANKELEKELKEVKKELEEVVVELEVSKEGFKEAFERFTGDTTLDKDFLKFLVGQLTEACPWTQKRRQKEWALKQRDLQQELLSVEQYEKLRVSDNAKLDELREQNRLLLKSQEELRSFLTPEQFGQWLTGDEPTTNTKETK